MSDIEISKPATYGGIVQIEAIAPDVPERWMLDGFVIKAPKIARAKEPAWHVYQIIRGSTLPIAGKTEYCLQNGLTKQRATEMMKQYAMLQWNEQLKAMA